MDFQTNPTESDTLVQKTLEEYFRTDLRKIPVYLMTKNAENKTIVAFRPHEGGVVFVITMHKLPKNSTLQSDIKYGVDQTHKSANSMASDIRIIESSPTILSHYPAHRIKYGFTMDR
jgi:hypothetical protein